MTEKTVFALGFFDGVHLGHQALLQACQILADDLGCRAGVVTFSAHPDTLVFGKAPALINTIQDRRQLLAKYGMDKILELPFDNVLRATSWQDFFAMLLQEYNAAGFVCGHDFRFGKNGEGNPDLLRSACEQAGVPCVVIPQQSLRGVPISSTHIRTLLKKGDMETAVAFLGHPHILTGTVVPGRQLGRTIGIPTANLPFPEDMVQLRYGVYACKAIAEGNCYLAVTNVGTRPTVEGDCITVEPWLLDFDGDLYGKPLTLLFYQFLRPEQKFPTLTHLQEEIQKNARQTRKIFEKNESFPLLLGKLMI